MIIDRLQLAGLNAYFQKSGTSGDVDLSSITRVRSKPLAPGQQLQLSGIEFVIQSSTDLSGLFQRQSSPLISIVLMKEMFPGLFANPFGTRIHSIGGFADFTRGKLENCRPMEVDGVPALVSLGTGRCRWISPSYEMVEHFSLGDHGRPVTLTDAAWEIAVSRKALSDSFHYALSILSLDHDGNVVDTIFLTNPINPAVFAMSNASTVRVKQGFTFQTAEAYRIEFMADVNREAALYEKHSLVIGDSLGTPLLKAVHLLERTSSAYEINSLQEMIGLSSDYHIFATADGKIKQMSLTIDFSATLTSSEQNRIDARGTSDPASVYDYVELQVVSGVFSRVEAKMLGEVSTTTR